MGFKITNKELDLFFKYAEGSVAVLFLLIAIRCTEQGGQGQEMGILDKRAEALEKQIRWARNTIVNNERRFEKKHPSILARSPNTTFSQTLFLSISLGCMPRLGQLMTPKGSTRTTWRIFASSTHVAGLCWVK